MRRAGAAVCLALLAATGSVAQTGESDLRLLSSEGLPAEHVALLMSDQQGGDLLFEQVASVVPLADGTPGLGFWLEVDADSLLLESVPERLFLKLTVYALRGSSIAFARSRAIEIVDPGRLLEVDGVRVSGAIPLDPGDYRFRVLVSEPDSGRLGIREDRLQVPRSGAPVVSALELVGVEAHWLDLSLDGARPPAGFFPSALAVVPTGEDWSVRVLTTGSDQLAIENGSSLGPEAVVVGDWSREPGPNGWTVATADVTLAPELSGRFEVAPVAITAGETKRRAFGDEFVVQQRRQADLERGGVTEVLVTSQVAYATSWTRLKRNTEVAESVVNAPVRSNGKKLTIPKRQVRQRLLEALQDFAAGEPGANERLAQLEAEAAGGSSQALATLAELELRTFASIQERQPEAVIPILSLYLDRYRKHLAAGEYFLSTHCKRVASALSQQVATQGEPEVMPAVADFFAAMGGQQVAGNDPAGADSLRAALAIDAGHRAALEILAWHLERNGRYQELVELVDAAGDPRPEVRLRRALAGLRLGRDDAWSELLELSQQPDWVGELAAQEAVRRQVVSGQYAAAGHAIEEARSRFPGSAKLTLLEALMHDLHGRPVESLEAMSRFSSSAVVGERHRYAGQPDEILQEVRRRLADRAEVGTSMLHQVLQDLT